MGGAQTSTLEEEQEEPFKHLKLGDLEEEYFKEIFHKLSGSTDIHSSHLETATLKQFL